MKLKNIIKDGAIFGAGVLTGFLAHTYNNTLEPIKEVITDPAFIGVMLLSMPVPAIATLGHYYLQKKLEKYE